MPLPLKPNDWVANEGGEVARVKTVYEFQGEVLADLVMFNGHGKKLGRISPPERGPRTFEPACSIEGWRRIAEPQFPVPVKWVPGSGGRMYARRWPGETLPPANWTPPKRRARLGRFIADDQLRKALQKIADGYNDARALAKQVLGQ